jgi:hypothetical protein
MRTKLLFLIQRLTGVTSLFIAAGLQAAPLTWFPGPPLESPRSGAATTLFSGSNLIIGGDSSAVEALAATNIYWTFFTPFSGATVSPGAVADGGMVIYFGGNDGTASTNATIGYSPSDGLSLLAPMNVARAQLGYAPDRSGNAYAIGGLDDNGTPLSSAERYDQDLNSWGPIASMPAARYNFPAVFNRTNYIFVFGGNTDLSGTVTATVLRYSVSANSWSSMAPMPVAVAGSAATLAADGKIYVAGGLSGGVATDTIQVYDPVANSWTISAPLPEALSASAIGSDSLGRLVVMGGIDAYGNDVGEVWRSQQLNAPDTVPVFVSYPSTSATYHIPYSSSISATGNPQPTYLLVSGPAGMQVDNYTGAITWTPEGNQVGTNSVTIRATNYAGFSDWNFSITVPYPPPPVVTNLTVVAATEYSVTLAWSPEDPVFGPVTYRAYLQHIAHSPRGSGVTITYSQIGTNSTVPTITITGLTPGLARSYYINATGPGGTSGYGVISATTLSPQPPTNLRVTGLTTTTVTLTWDPSPGPVPIASYEVWGWMNGGITSAIYGTGITNTTFTVTGLTPGSVHEWGVRAHDAGGYASGFDYGPTVMNPAPSTLTAGAVLPDGSFQFSVSQVGSGLQTVVIQATSEPGDPNSWQQIGSLLPTTNPFTFTDSNAAQYPVRFYRVVSQ